MGETLLINGPIVTARLPGSSNGEQVRIGALGLIGEVIARDGECAVIQVYESTESLRPGEPVEALGGPLAVELGPGLLGQIFDGVQRPLRSLLETGSSYIPRGLSVAALDRERLWHFVPAPQLAPGASVTAGSILGTVRENATLVHRILVPPDVKGELVYLAVEGDYSIEVIIAQVRCADGRVRDLKLYQRWPVREPRPYRIRKAPSEPLLTGQRVLDTFFPLLKGGKAAIPGPFGVGKTMVQQQIARWSNAEVVIYVGCGERGNELVDILETFPQLTDPHTGRPLMERTMIIANTSNMPVVAREASVYVGITLAEYFRDQGYDVVVVADSTSRWAEALREVAGRLGQMPVEEGYPAYLASRLAAFYERAGTVETLAGTDGSITLIGAVSPPGGDFSEPVTSHTKDIVQTLWALSKELADARHYPAIGWSESFSAYVEGAAAWWTSHLDARWPELRARALSLLAEADQLSHIVNLVGPEALSAEQRWVVQGAALVRDGILQQSALDPTDSYASPEKQLAVLDAVLAIYDQGVRLLAMGVPVQQLTTLPIIGQARRLKGMYSSGQIAELRAFVHEVTAAFQPLHREYQQAALMGHPLAEA